MLQGTADAVRRALREGDRVGRWGGEEFLVILSGQDRGAAARVAARLQAAVAGTEYPGLGAVTVSCGVAQHRRGESVEALLARADEALYAAKRDGRDLVRVAS